MNTGKSDLHTLWSLIKDTRFGMLTHRHPGGLLHAHPLTTQTRSLDEGSELYFFISKSSELASAIAQDGNVNVSYANTDAVSYVSISGDGRISQDAGKIEKLWNPVAKAWFSGPDDPDLALLAVHIAHAEYWDVKESKMVQLFKMAKAAFTGTQPQLGEHKEVSVS